MKVFVMQKFIIRYRLSDVVIASFLNASEIKCWASDSVVEDSETKEIASHVWLSKEALNHLYLLEPELDIKLRHPNTNDEFRICNKDSELVFKLIEVRHKFQDEWHFILASEALLLIHRSKYENIELNTITDGTDLDALERILSHSDLD